MLIHVPIGEKFPQDLAEQIAAQGIEIMPTMVMMKAFADSPVYGYEEEDYQDAADAFGLENAGRIAPGQPATMVLLEGRPDQNITDSLNIVQIWVDGKPVLDNKDEDN